MSHVLRLAGALNSRSTKPGLWIHDGFENGKARTGHRLIFHRVLSQLGTLLVSRKVNPGATMDVPGWGGVTGVYRRKLRYLFPFCKHHPVAMYLESGTLMHTPSFSDSHCDAQIEGRGRYEYAIAEQ
jgi:hypothetical protein